MPKNNVITIFLIDDNALYLKNLELTFSSKPYYNVVTFATGELCLEKLDLKPDIIILDYYLNSVKKDAMNGLETLIRIRAVNKDVPVIMLSVETSAEVAENCIAHTANEFIIKDEISFAKLREIITAVFIDKQTKKDVISSFNNQLRSVSLVVLIFAFFGSCFYYFSNFK